MTADGTIASNIKPSAPKCYGISVLYKPRAGKQIKRRAKMTVRSRFIRCQLYGIKKVIEDRVRRYFRKNEYSADLGITP